MLCRLLVQIQALHPVLAGMDEVVLRSLLAAATALLFCLAFGGAIVAGLRRLKLQEKTEKTPIEDEALRRRIESKSGTPTMGGLMVLGALLAACLLWARMRDGLLAAALAAAFAMATLGAVDDLMKLHARGRRARGFKIRYKLLIQAPIGAAVGLLILRMTGGFSTSALPGSLLGPLVGAGGLAAAAFAVWAALVVGGTSNATNITDGMDGLLAGLTPLAAVVLGGACLAGAADAPEATELAVFCGALAGACLGFLIFNRHPARVFLGDTGSLAIGGALAAVALAAHLELLLGLVGVIFFVEIGSSVLQIGWFKVFGRRILPIAPMHYIFQKKGIAEPRIVMGFYLWGAVAALAGVNLLGL